MPLYDVEFKVTFRTNDPHIEEAKTFAFLALEERLFGGVHVSDPGQSHEAALVFVRERFEETGLMIQVIGAEKVVTPQPYPVT